MLLEKTFSAFYHFNFLLIVHTHLECHMYTCSLVSCHECIFDSTDKLIQVFKKKQRDDISLKKGRAGRETS